MWPRDKQLYVLTWISTLASIIGLVFAILALVKPQGFPLSTIQLVCTGVALLLVGAVGLGLWGRLLRAIRRPDMETIKIEKCLTISNESGNDAILVRISLHRANRKVFNHTLTVGGIATTGAIKEMRIDDEAIPKADWRLFINDWQVSNTKSCVLEPGQTISRKLWLWVIDSFAKEHETLCHDVSQETEELVLTVIFPPQRKPNHVCAFMAFGDQTHSALADPTVSRDRGKAEIVIKRPQLGAVYRLEWDW